MGATKPKTRSINCTQCGGSLKLYGGHQVKSINCGYCGSVLDSKKEYKMVKRFKGVKRPFSPISIGSDGWIKGVLFTVIGMVEYVAADARWVSLQLFSPTHGYAWLDYEKGHFVFARKVRDTPQGFNKYQVKSRFKARDKSFKVYESYTARINFVEGELTWIAEKGDQLSITEGIKPPHIFSAEQSADELEYCYGEYLEPEVVYRAFGLKKKPYRKYGVHAAEPYRPNKYVAGISEAGLIFLPLVGLLCLVVAIMGHGKKVFTVSIQPDQFLNGVETRLFNVSQPDRLLKLGMNANLNNAWAWFDITISNEHRELFSLAKQISYYHGYEGGEYWHEGNKTVNAYFKVPEAGYYRLHISGDGGTGNRGTQPQLTPLNITIEEGIIVSRYLLGLLVIVLLATLLLYFRKWQFEYARWEEDDD